MRFRYKILILSALASSSALTKLPAFAQGSSRPPLVITNAPLPADLKERIYSKPMQVQDIEPNQVVGRDYYQNIPVTKVSAKVDEIGNNLYNIQSNISGLSATLNGLQRNNEQKAATYYASTATINTQLQVGTTPGNPRLMQKIDVARTNLENLNTGLGELSILADDVAQTASEASYLLEATRAAYALSGAIEEDHVKLAELEDAINNTLVVIDRILNTVNDDITRSSAYLSSERSNLRTLALGVTNGDLYGISLANRPFSNVPEFIQASTGSNNAVSSQSLAPRASAGGALSSPRPLVKIRFDRANIDYQQPIYLAVNEALERYPNARFDLVAIHPTSGNAAEVAIESTKARRNAESVLRTLTQMGLSSDRVDLAYNKSDVARSIEVHLYIK